LTNIFHTGENVSLCKKLSCRMGDNDAVLNELVVCVELKIDYEIHFEILLQLHCFSPQLSCLKREPDLENSMKHET